jgi:hypothetical protein
MTIYSGLAIMHDGWFVRIVQDYEDNTASVEVRDFREARVAMEDDQRCLSNAVELLRARAARFLGPEWRVLPWSGDKVDWRLGWNNIGKELAHDR